MDISKGRLETLRKKKRLNELRKKKELLSARKSGETKAKHLEDINKEVGGFESTLIGIGRGITDIGRAVGLADEEPNIVKESFTELEEQRPITQGVGRAVGQSLPFLAPGVGVGAIASIPARVAAGTGLGALEGAAIAKGTDQDILKGASIGGAIAGVSEAVFPVISRMGSALFKSVRKKTPKGSLFDFNGKPNKEMQSALDSSGITMEELTSEAESVVRKHGTGVDPVQAERQARFKTQGVPATKGDITQDFAQQAQESRLFESSADSLGDPVRSLRLKQSDALVSNLNALKTDGVSDGVGEQIKSALTGRETFLRKKKNLLYKAAAEQAEKVDNIPVFTDSLIDSMPDKRVVSRIERLVPNEATALKGLLAEFGIDQSDEAVELLAKSGIEPQPLTLSNFDEFRIAIGQIESADKTGAIKVLTGDIKKALDLEVDNLATSLEKSGITDKNILDPLLEARETVRTMKTEFSPQSVAGRLISSKKDGVTPVIEASKVYKEVAGAGKPIELLQRTITSLKQSGAQGKQAMADLQSATVIDLIESGFKSQGRKVQGAPLFNVTAFNNKIAQLGDDKLKLLFANNPKAYRSLKQISKTARDIRPADSAVPKGSGSVILDTLNKLGILKLSSSVPGIGLLIEGMKGLGDKSTNRRILSTALDGTPNIKESQRLISDIAPSLAVALGIQVEEQTNEKGGN